jgi:hypothetical protein
VPVGLVPVPVGLVPVGLVDAPGLDVAAAAFGLVLVPGLVEVPVTAGDPDVPGDAVTAGDPEVPGEVDAPGEAEVPGDALTPGEVEVPGDATRALGETPGDVEVPGDAETPGEADVPGDVEVPGDAEVPGDTPATATAPLGTGEEDVCAVLAAVRIWGVVVAGAALGVTVTPSCPTMEVAGSFRVVKSFLGTWLMLTTLMLLLLMI